MMSHKHQTQVQFNQVCGLLFVFGRGRERGERREERERERSFSWFNSNLFEPLFLSTYLLGDAVVSVTMKVSYDDPVANLVDIKLKSMAAISIAINYYQTVSALSQYPSLFLLRLALVSSLFLFSSSFYFSFDLVFMYFALPNSVITLLAASKILSSATGAGVGLACISSQLNKYENLYTAVMLEPIIVGAGIGILYPLPIPYLSRTYPQPIPYLSLFISLFLPDILSHKTFLKFPLAVGSIPIQDMFFF